MIWRSGIVGRAFLLFGQLFLSMKPFPVRGIFIIYPVFLTVFAHDAPDFPD